MPRLFGLIGSVACEKRFYVNSYSVISSLNTSQVAIILRSIEYLRQAVYAFDGDNEKDEKNSCSCLWQVPYSFYTAGS